MANEPSTYVTLVSNDGFEFVVRRESAYVAGTIKRMLDPASEPHLHCINHVTVSSPMHQVTSPKPSAGDAYLKTSSMSDLLVANDMRFIA